MKETLAAWRSPLARALHRNRSLPYARYVQLATVQLDGRPANRTVVFRGFWNDTNQLKFVTDARSEKTAQIGQLPFAEVCWYFPTTREQFRLSGRLTLITAEEADLDRQTARHVAWRELSDAARAQFAWADPGQPRAAREAFEGPPTDPNQPLPQFCLLLLAVDRVDHLELRGDPQNRYLYSLSGSDWKVQEVNP